MSSETNTNMGNQNPQPAILAQRLQIMQDWLKTAMTQSPKTMTPLLGDASFRRYFRVQFADGQQFVLMDAPPQQEDCTQFAVIAAQMHAYGVAVPKIFAKDLQQGFILMEDFGDQLYLTQLQSSTANALYHKAFCELLKIQQMPRQNLPLYSEALLREEMQLFIDWYLGKYQKIALTTADSVVLEKVFVALIESIKQQPQVCVHRDFHSRNLLLTAAQGVGVLDFQDAVWGPLTYDLVSLLKDCYIDWPIADRQALTTAYFNLLPAQWRLACSVEQFERWFDWVGLQRHLKCLGIFARLHLRDQKSGYLVHLPRILQYVREVCMAYPELSDLLKLLR